MSLDYINKLSSLVGEGFFVNDLLFLIKKNDKRVNKEELQLLQKALRYFQKIEKARRLMRKGKYFTNMEDLEAYTRSLKIKAWKDMKEYKTNQTYIIAEIVDTITCRTIYSLRLRKTEEYFKLLRTQLLRECSKIRRCM